MEKFEHEYSFKVTNIKPFLKYCKDNNYKKIEVTDQTRILYKKPDKTMLRLTIKKQGRKVIKELDFKEDNLTNELYRKRRESLSMKYEDDEAVNSIIEFLGYKKARELIRKRNVYAKENVKFEIDDYISPEEMLVVGIEGDPSKIKVVYEELNHKFSKYFKK